MFTSPNFSITNLTRQKLSFLPRLERGEPFLELKEKVLGKKYELSLVFIGSTRSRNLNRTHRGKDTPTNILSFELSKTSGEIFIDITLSKKQSKKFGRTEDNFLQFLLIHGLFHLKGMAHGDTMEKAEQKVRNKFKI